MIKKVSNLFNNKRFKKISLVCLLLFVLVLLMIIPRTLAVLTPVKSVEIFSEKSNYDKKDPGSWKINKSAKWLGNGEAEITFKVDTIYKQRIDTSYQDIIFVLDVSGSMAGAKIDRVKNDTIDLINKLLLTEQNRAGLITFESSSNIVSQLTNNKDELVEKVETLTTTGCTNYYQALVNVDSILKDYVNEADRECVVLFLTDGYPNEDIPNEEAQYSYLKNQYPFISISGIQYEMGSSILEPIKKVSDNQYIAVMETLNNVLFEAYKSTAEYDNFEIVDFVDTNYFYIESVNDIKVSRGSFLFDKDTQKVTWKIKGFKCGTNSDMTIKVKLKKELLNVGGVYPTNEKEIINSKIDEDEENIESTKTPVLRDNYHVIYDGNGPDGCKVTGVPEKKQHIIFDTVAIDKNVPACEGYQFKRWKITTDNINRLNDDYFVMPESDVTITAEWSKLNINKSMDGTIKEQVTLYKQFKLDYENGKAKKYNGEVDETFKGKDDIYYYTGATTNNNVIFGGFCWQMYRTTDTGGVKMAYNGEPDSNGSCGTDRGNHVGYNIPTNIYYSEDLSSEYLYGTDYTYNKSTGTFTVSGSTETTTWGNSTYEGLVNKYTCKNTTGSCNELYYTLSYASDTKANTLKLNNSASYYSINSGWISRNYNDTYGDFGYMNDNTLTSDNEDIVPEGSTSYVFSNSVTYKNGSYSLSGTLKSTFNYSDMDNTHYTCWNTTGKCSKVSYIYQIEKNRYYPSANYYYVYYIVLEDGLTIESKLEELLVNTDDDSTVKQIMDAWYSKNMTQYSGYLEDPVWCNDRTVSNLGFWNRKGGSGALEFRANTNDSSLTCPRIDDRFTVSSQNGNGLLNYPVGLVTIPELRLAYSSNSSPLVPGKSLTLSPMTLSSRISYGYLSNNGEPTSGVLSTSTLRPAISIHGDVTYANGNGSADEPYVVDTQSSDYYSIKIQGSDDVKVSASTSIEGGLIKLIPPKGSIISSFKVNNKTVSGNYFVMPAENVEITDIRFEKYVIESAHNSYSNNLNSIKEKTFDGATSLKVELYYQTESIRNDYIYLYNSNGTRYGSYGGSTSTNNITISGNYIKIQFRTNDSLSNYYGYKATITPIYN